MRLKSAKGRKDQELLAVYQSSSNKIRIRPEHRGHIQKNTISVLRELDVANVSNSPAKSDETEDEEDKVVIDYNEYTKERGTAF